MSTHKGIDRICVAAVVLSLLIALVFLNAETVGLQQADSVLGYEDRLFDTAHVHTIEIVMDDWEGFLETCENEEYAVCSVVIDGETYANVGIRAKGNTSLSSVASMDSDRYSFKVEFDQYVGEQTYHGLDKLNLNNVIYDNTYMKDYLTYQLMGSMGVAAPLCSYAYLTVNGEDWGLYLAVEGVEESFLQRNYGADYGELYKPDSMNFGGGRGNGREFDMEDFSGLWGGDAASGEEGQSVELPEAAAGFAPGGGGMAFPGMGGAFGGGGPGMPSPDAAGETAQQETASEKDVQQEVTQQEGVQQDAVSEETAPEGAASEGERPEQPGGGGGFSLGGMGSEDVRLQYIDDDPDSYSNIFDSAKTDPTDADKARLIQSLKSLSEGEDLERVVDVEAVIRYFVVHNFVCNGDSYTGTMVHNYYLYEEDGQLSMIPWDYNLAFGTFDAAGATSSVNTPIDTPVSGGAGEDRPMISWIFSSEEYTALYHQYFAQFLAETDFETLIRETEALIAPYVERDPTKFCTYEEFETGVDTLLEFCLLREESIQGQLDGTIPSTTQGQTEDASALVDASHITISDMGSMNMGGGGGDRGGDAFGGSFAPPGVQDQSGGDGGSAELPAAPNAGTEGETAQTAAPQAEGFVPSGLPQGFTSPEGTQGAFTEGPPALPEGMQDLSQAGESDASVQGEGETSSQTEGEAPELTDETGDAAGGGGRFEGMEGSFPGAGDGSAMPGGAGAAGESGGEAVLLGISLAVLAAGLAIALLFKR